VAGLVDNPPHNGESGRKLSFELMPVSRYPLSSAKTNPTPTTSNKTITATNPKIIFPILGPLFGTAGAVCGIIESDKAGAGEVVSGLAAGGAGGVGNGVEASVLAGGVNGVVGGVGDKFDPGKFVTESTVI
jgi:hypothetical protein